MDFHTARVAVRSFGRRVRAYRIATGMSQPELGRRARVSAKYIGEIERGTSNPSLVTMLLVADALDCELSSLFPHDTRGTYVALAVEDVRRAMEAVTVVASVLSRRRKNRL